MSDRFTGEETAADILQAVLDEFSQHPPKNLDAKIIYPGGAPYLEFRERVKGNLGEFVCHYRLEKMLMQVFPHCEQTYNEFVERGLFGKGPSIEGQKLIRVIAFHGMNTMLHRLMLLQLAMFEENFDDVRFLVVAQLFQGLAVARDSSESDITREANKAIRTLLDKTIKITSSKKRKLLVDLLNALPLLNIPTSSGRPTGSTKPLKEKKADAATFETKIEEAIGALLAAKGKMPTKTAVAKELKMGGVSPKTGNDTRLNSFNNKLRRLGVDYGVIAARVKLHK